MHVYSMQLYNTFFQSTYVDKSRKVPSWSLGRLLILMMSRFKKISGSCGEFQDHFEAILTLFFLIININVEFKLWRNSTIRYINHTQPKILTKGPPMKRKFVACKGIQDCFAFWIPRGGFRISGTGLRILCQWTLDSGFQSLVGFRISWAAFRISQARIS